jgi:hypothetical protein
MDWQDECACVRDLPQEAPARLRGLDGISVENGRPIGFPALKRMVHEVTRHHRFLALRTDPDAAMAGRMTGRRNKRESVVELKRVVDQQSLSRLDDRPAILAP